LALDRANDHSDIIPISASITPTFFIALYGAGTSRRDDTDIKPIPVPIASFKIVAKGELSKGSRRKTQVVAFTVPSVEITTPSSSRDTPLASGSIC
jgi:hypothetical protein